jgi:hypothetical protein
MRTVWPFWGGDDLPVRKSTHLDWIAPDIVIGASDGWRPQDMTEEQIESLFVKTNAQIQHFQKTGKWESYIDTYGFIGAHPQAWELMPFHLCVVHEGKNRVAAFAKHNRPIAYDMRQVYFPPPEELALEQQNGAWRIHWTGRGSRDIRYCAEVLVPLFKAYGVEEREVTRVESAVEKADIPFLRKKFLAWFRFGARK